jgi:two-component system sensor histidine kinase CpxA
MRGSIFIKIFFGFWLVSITVLGSWQLASQYFDSLSFTGVTHRPGDASPQRRVMRIIWALENSPDSALPRLLADAHDKHKVHIWMLDEAGVDLMQRPVPPEVTALAERLRHGRRRAFKLGRNSYLTGHVIVRPDQRRWRLVLALPPPPHRVLGLLGANPWLRLLLAMVVSGLACWALSRLMTNRLRDLRQASRRLAEGDLAARIKVRDRGGDETDELARDFNAMADQLQSRIQAQRQLLRDVSHELRSPLARMRVALALAADATSKREDYLQRIDAETERLEELISQLLSSQQHDLPMDKHIDLNALLRQLCADASFEGEASGKRVELRTTVQQAIVASSGDLLLKSFDNIIRNALQHTPEGTAVSVRLAEEGQCYRIEIEDCGPGVEAAELQRIFDEFYRVDSARSREEGGYGLGLAIARRAIEQHRGQVSAANTGAGLCVTVTLSHPQANGA